MTPERWAQIRQVFDGALERSPKDRAAYLRVTCAGDDAMRREVESLLASHADASGFLAKPAVDLGYTLHYSGEESGEYPAGFRAGPYQLEKRVGRGGMGSVWLASRPEGPKVAVKLVKRGMDTAEILRRFRMERQVLASLDHPNIARLIDGGSTPEGLPYLAMEYVEGTPIDQFCESRANTISDRLKLFRDVCAAVQYAHQNLVVHRDIKTGNILVTPAGVVKLLDFGIAKLLRTDLSTLEAAQTRPELRPMTLDYASPEQVRGDAITTSTDVYSLGVLLYKLLTGRMPYGLTTRSPDTIRKAILETEPRRPSAVILTDETHAIPQATQKMEVAVTAETRELARKRLKKKLSGDLDIIILKALRKEPQKRYLSVEQFSEDIRRYLEGRPVIARSDTPGYRFTKFVRRNALSVAAAGGLVGILFGSTIFFAYREREDTRHFNDATVSLERQLLHADLDIDSAERVQEAYNLANSIWRANPEQDESRRDLAQAASKMGDLATDRNAAAKFYGEALTQFDLLAQRGEHNERALEAVATKIGGIELERGNLLAALSNFSRALQIAEGFAAAEGATPSPQTRLTVADANADVGEVLLRNGARPVAVAKLKKAIGLYRDLGRADRATALEDKLKRP